MTGNELGTGSNSSGEMLNICLNRFLLILIASHEKAFTYTTIIVIYVFVNFYVIIFINYVSIHNKLGRNQFKFDNLLESTKIKSKGTYRYLFK